GTWDVGMKVWEKFWCSRVYGNCPGDERGIVGILAGIFVWGRLGTGDQGVKFRLMANSVPVTHISEAHALSKPVTSTSVSTPQESKGVNNDKVIAPGMFRINPFKTSREEKHMPNTVRASTRTKSITVSQPPVFTKKDVNFDLNSLSST
nr:hypothetical protein [Tanacetum cinerariifolium]